MRVEEVWMVRKAAENLMDTAEGLFEKATGRGGGHVTPEEENLLMKDALKVIQKLLCPSVPMWDQEKM